MYVKFNDYKTQMACNEIHSHRNSIKTNVRTKTGCLHSGLGKLICNISAIHRNCLLKLGFTVTLNTSRAKGERILHG